LIPRLKNWISTSYPGTLTGITEYNWGAENHINGATAQADILGIFGREGLDMAARWATPASTTPTYKAMKMYRNYDGAGSAFGETSVAATTVNVDTVAAFAAQRSADGALTVMVVSKYLSANTPVTINLANFAQSGAVQVWQLTAVNAVNHLPAIALTGNSFVASLPPQSITLFVVPGTSNVPSPPRAPTGLKVTSK